MTPVWAGLLAAGAGRRMGGRPKALLRHEGLTFLERIVATARGAGVSGVSIVLGYHGDSVRGPAQALCDSVATNSDPSRGMTSSARSLARALPRGAAMLLWPVDHPVVRPSTIEALLAAGLDHPDRLIAPVHGGAAGHPPLLPSFVVDSLRRAPVERRLDHLLVELAGAPLEVMVHDEGVLRDVDRPEELASLPNLGR